MTHLTSVRENGLCLLVWQSVCESPCGERFVVNGVPSLHIHRESGQKDRLFRLITIC